MAVQDGIECLLIPEPNFRSELPEIMQRALLDARLSPAFDIDEHDARIEIRRIRVEPGFLPSGHTEGSPQARYQRIWAGEGGIPVEFRVPQRGKVLQNKSVAVEPEGFADTCRQPGSDGEFLVGAQRNAAPSGEARKFDGGAFHPMHGNARRQRGLHA